MTRISQTSHHLEVKSNERECQKLNFEINLLNFLRFNYQQERKVMQHSWWLLKYAKTE